MILPVGLLYSRVVCDVPGHAMMGWCSDLRSEVPAHPTSSHPSQSGGETRLAATTQQSLGRSVNDQTDGPPCSNQRVTAPEDV